MRRKHDKMVNRESRTVIGRADKSKKSPLDCLIAEAEKKEEKIKDSLMLLGTVDVGKSINYSCQGIQPMQRTWI
jgi:polynucleotide 5'-kinase involved in rRNA processing